MAKRIAGTMYLKIDGEQLEVSGGFECPGMEFKREAVLSATGVAGYKETVVKPYIKGTCLFVAGFPLNTLRTNTEMTATVEFANGKVYTLSSAFVENELPVKADDGTVELELAGTRGIWQ